MSETTLNSVFESEKSNAHEIIQIEEENSVSISIEDTGQGVGNTKNIIYCDEAGQQNPGHRGVEYDVYYNTEKNTDLKTGFRPQAQKHWVFFWNQAANQVEPTGSPLDYDPESRNGFVRKVFVLVLMMLLFTCAFNAAVYNMKFLTNIFGNKLWAMCLLIGATLVMYVMHYVLFCSQCSRSSPCNYICLVIISVAMSIIVACISIRYKIIVIAMSIGITTIITFICLVLACTNFDFTKYMLYFIVISTALFLVGTLILILMFVFKWKIKPLHIGILVVFVLLSAASLVMQIQMILGGKTVELGEDDYAIAAFMVYSSIIEMFMLILRIINLTECDI